MKEFIKWLGVNEKVAKVVVWLMIIMVMLIIINASLSSIGFPHYRITYDNIKTIKTSYILEVITAFLACALNFLSIVMIVFRVKELKRVSKYVPLYVAFNWLITNIFNEATLQVFIIIFVIVFCYLYSNKHIIMIH